VTKPPHSQFWAAQRSWCSPTLCWSSRTPCCFLVWVGPVPHSILICLGTWSAGGPGVRYTRSGTSELPCALTLDFRFSWAGGRKALSR
jgi:hypothetical protein